MKIGQSYITINGITWIKEDVPFEGEINVSNIEALELAKKYKARVPNSDDYKKLLKLSHKFIPETSEWIFAETNEELKKGFNVLKFKFNGWIYVKSDDRNMTTAAYWCDLNDEREKHASYLFFNEFKVQPPANIQVHDFLFSLKLIKL